MEQPEHEQEAAIGQEALARGDLRHAAQHMAAALSGDPLRAEWRATLERILALAPQPLELFAPGSDGPVFFGTVAAHAYALAGSGDYQEALDLLLQVAAVKPEVPYLDWATEWLDSPDVVQALDPERVCLYLANWLQRYTGARPLDRGELSGLERLAPVLERLLEVHQEAFGLLVLSAAALRRIGRHHAALDCAERAYGLKPGWHAATSVAMVHRDASQLEEAVAWYERALEHDPHDLSARLDLGDMLGRERRLEDAARWYSEVLEREPEHLWATPSLCWVRWLQSEEQRWLDRLIELAGNQPPNDRARELLAELASAGQPYLAYLPEPNDASVNFLRQIGDRLAKGRKVEMTVSSLEAPSTRTAFRLHVERLGVAEIELDVTVREVQDPDPRLARGPVEYLLWEFEGTEPVPAVDPPLKGGVLDELVRIATSPYDPDLWSRRGRALVEDEGHEALRVLLGAMVYPPSPPDTRETWSWVRQVQFAAAFAIGHLDEGWRGSLRRQVLLSLLRGPMDWSVEAAVTVLAYLSQSDLAIEAEVAGELLDMATSIPRPGHCCYEAAVLTQLLALPSLPPDLRPPLESQLESLWGEQGEDSL